MDSSIERHSIGALVTSTRSFLECSQTVIKLSRRAGMHVLGGARANLAASTISNNGDTGCFAQHAHSTMLARDSVFTGNGTSGALVSVGASMHLFDCELTENRIAGAQSTVRPPTSLNLCMMLEVLCFRGVKLLYSPEECDYRGSPEAR